MIGLTNTMLISLFILLNMNKLHAQPSELKLDQIELMKQFLGTWKGELDNNTIFMCENKQFGNGAISNSMITTDGMVVDSVVQIYGYDNKTEKFIIAELKESSPVIELCSIWFTSENTGEIIIINPENTPLRFKFEFMSPNMIEQTAIQDNKVVNKIVLKRVEENKYSTNSCFY